MKLNSPCVAAIPALGAPANSAARFAALPRNSAAPARTSLFPDTRGPDCSAENDAVRNAPLPRRAPATEWLRQNAPAQSDTRQYRYKDCQTPDPDRWRDGTPRSRRRCAPENDRSSPERCALRQSDANPAKIDTVRPRVRNRLPSALGKHPAGLPMHGSEFPGSCFIVSTQFRTRQKYESASRARMEPVPNDGAVVFAKQRVTDELARGGVAICAANVQNKRAAQWQLKGEA